MAVNSKKADKKNKADEALEQEENKQKANNQEISRDNSATDTVEGLKNLINEKQTPKNKGGRPKLSEDDKRKKYTLTLSKNTYERFLSVAHNNNISLSVLLENATEEYIKNNNLC